VELISLADSVPNQIIGIKRRRGFEGWANWLIETSHVMALSRCSQARTGDGLVICWAVP